MTTSVHPVLMTSDVMNTAQFFTNHLGFMETFASDWYVSLRLDRWELAVLDTHHESIPSARRGPACGGVLINIEVDDVDEYYRRLVVDGDLDVIVGIRSEAFGQRHFIVAGPEGVLIDIITPIEPSPEFLSQYLL